MKKIITFILAALLLAPLAALDAAEPTSKPNIVFLLGDDLRPDCFGALGHPIVKTPNVDKLVEDGFIFRQAHILGSDKPAVCIPSRRMIMTGVSYFQTQSTAPTLAKTIQTAQYASIRSGKPGNNVPLDNDFDVAYYGGGTQTADDYANHIISFIKENAGKKPLFLYFAPHEPHDPQHASKTFYEMYKPADIPLPVNFLPFHPFNNGEMRVRDEATLPWPRTKENVTGKLARYYASISFFDAQVGRIVAALKQAGQFDNTIFAIAGDNGLSLGEHGLLGKQNLYEFGGMHVPLIFAGQGVRKGESQSLVYLMDVYPTFCELAGIPVPQGLDGKSLAPVIVGRESKVRECLFTAYRQCQRSIRDDRWKLIRYPLINKTQLFDLQNDPHEMNDLSGNSDQASKITELMDLLKKQQLQYGDTAPLEVAKPQNPAWAPPKKKAE